jgi:hypothetical protein
LERLHRRRVVVALDLEGDGKAVPDVQHSRVLPGPLQHTLAARRQSLQQRRGVLVAAVLRPEQREHRKLEVVRVALEQIADTVELAVREAERAMKRLGDDPRQGSENRRPDGRVRFQK